MDLVLIRLVDMGFNRVLSDHHFRYIDPTDGSSCFPCICS